MPGDGRHSSICRDSSRHIDERSIDMSPRRHTISPRSRPGVGGDRRVRVAVVAGAVVALLGIAAVVGQDGSSDRSSTQTSGSADRSGGAGELPRDAAPSNFDAASEADAGGGETAADAPAMGDFGADAGGIQTASQALAPLDAKIVRTGTVSVEVKKGGFDAATVRLSAIATGAGGFVSASEISALDDLPRGSVTLRVPVESFDEVVGDVSKMGDVIAVNTSSQDVSGEYTDLTSRLKALQSEREQITLVLGRAENIPDILAVRDRLSIVQGEIEQLQGRQNLLDDQTSLSTLTVSLSEVGDPAAAAFTSADRTGFSKLWHDSVDRFTDGGRSIALGLATMAPWLLLGLVLFFPARLLWRRAAPLATNTDSTTSSSGPPATVSS